MLSRIVTRRYRLVFQITLWSLSSMVFRSGNADAQTRSRVYGDQLTKQSQTLYIEGDVQATTYESEEASSKETNENSFLKVGVWTGEERSVGFEMASNEVKTKFGLNGNTVNSAFRDIRLSTRLGWLLPSVGASLTEVDVSTPETEKIGIFATGIYAGLRIAVPITLEMVVHGEGMVSSPTKSYD